MGHKADVYEKYIKRILDFMLSLLALIVLSPILIILTIVGAVKMKGNPFFTQLRPGKDEKIFKIIKFRTMTNAEDSEGNLLSDDVRLTKYGEFLRATSLDELPELLNILKGDMSIVGPRPQLVRDMVFMTPEQRQRHSVRQGLTGLAQISGRNSISWEKKIEYDLGYIKNITFLNDVRIVIKTVSRVLLRKDVIREDTVSDVDLGDWLLRDGKITSEEYVKAQKQAKIVLQACKR